MSYCDTKGLQASNVFQNKADGEDWRTLAALKRDKLQMWHMVNMHIFAFVFYSLERK